MMRRLQDHFSPFVRMYMGGHAVVTWYSATANPESTLAFVASTDDGSIIVWVLGMLGTIMLLDLLINDWSPKSIGFGTHRIYLNWQRTWRYRHWLFVGIAACYAAQPLIADAAGQNIAVMIVCYWNSFINMAAAFIDAGERSRQLWWQKTYS